MYHKLLKKILSNIDNKSMILIGSIISEDWSNDAENSALITAINYILKYIKIDFYIVIDNITVFVLHYRSNKCSPWGAEETS